MHTSYWPGHDGRGGDAGLNVGLDGRTGNAASAAFPNINEIRPINKANAIASPASVASWSPFVAQLARLRHVTSNVTARWQNWQTIIIKVSEALKCLTSQDGGQYTGTSVLIRGLFCKFTSKQAYVPTTTGLCAWTQTVTPSVSIALGACNEVPIEHPNYLGSRAAELIVIQKASRFSALRILCWADQEGEYRSVMATC